MSVGQRLVQGQDEAIRWHGSDLTFFRLPCGVAAGGDYNLVSNLKQACQKVNTSNEK